MTTIVFFGMITLKYSVVRPQNGAAVLEELERTMYPVGHELDLLGGCYSAVVRYVGRACSIPGTRYSIKNSLLFCCK